MTKSLITPDLKRARKLAALKMARENLASFAVLTCRGYRPNWHHKVLAENLTKLMHGEIDRLMVLMPPRHGKSELASVRFPAWFLGHFPQKRIIATSYSARLAEVFGRRVRDLAAGGTFGLVFPNLRLKEGAKAANRWETTEGGGYVSAGVGGSITGMGGDLLIIDDPFKNQEEADSEVYREKVWEWYQSTLYTRIEKGGKILVILTRWHEDDLAGRLLQQSGEDWTVVSFPAVAEEEEEFRRTGDALWPEKYSLETLKRMEKAVGSRVWNALYQQRPAPASGAVFRREWWRFYDELPAGLKLFQSWDMTFKDSAGADYVVGQVWGVKGSEYYLIDQVRERMDFSQAVKALKALSAQYPDAAAKYIEDKANGPAVISALKGSVGGLIAVNPRGSKTARANAVSPLIEAGNVFLKRGAAFTQQLIEEAVYFPAGKHDDMVDAMTQALSANKERTAPLTAFSGAGRGVGRMINRY
ncbi:phage terminase large subunit [Seleniivibrio woodruffii]|uniref:Putative phage terminase large subunit-like protein n=1 Tax=Seleniivibrio woodruffii TaxID=1078050 RepID=A0A4R1K9K6_9BACT|nr:phage terminase large subunit [Seleniivibrio woodruffii]TCK59849.1 putative phage terminase large subunit-like protein [Seleniivibrio woodruffii]TVZ35930.1 putative phage terminase large subunit-like protein [Seleniivibrio woodruffii]